jgi:hypothetical protein
MDLEVLMSSSSWITQVLVFSLAIINSKDLLYYRLLKFFLNSLLLGFLDWNLRIIECRTHWLIFKRIHLFLDSIFIRLIIFLDVRFILGRFLRGLFSRGLKSKINIQFNFIFISWDSHLIT